MTKKGKLPNPDNYEISDLRWDDFTEEATMPNKSIPNWARSKLQIFLTLRVQLLKFAFHYSGVNLKVALNQQLNEDIDTESLFPAEVLRCGPDLNELFEIECDRFNRRTSSAVWKTPPSNYM